MSMQDILTNIFKSAYPDKSDEDINAQVSSLSQAPGDALQKALSFIPGVGAGQAAATLAPEAASEATDAIANSNTVQSPIKALLSGEGGNPISAVSQGLVEGVAKDAFAPSSTSPDEGPGPTPDDLKDSPAVPTLAPTLAPEVTDSSPTPSATAPAAVKAAPKSGAEALLPTPEQTSADNDARKAMLHNEHNKRLLGGIASAGAGIGDAITNASTAFGGSAHSNNQDQLDKDLSANEDKNKAQFEESLKNNPNSDISKHYQKVLGLMMGKHPDDPALTKMSAATISQTLPEVEKYMQKELQMQAIKANKDLSMSMQSNNERDRLWNQGVQTLNSVRGDKNLVQSETMRDGAISARQAIDHIQSQGRAPNQFEYIDLLGQLWKARTGATLNNEELKHMDVKTIQSTLGPIATYLTGDPKAIISTAATNALRDFVDQSGKTADQLHDNYMQTRGINAASTRMKQAYPEDADRLAKMSRGMSYADAVKASPTANQPQTKTINGRNFVSHNGQWYEVK